MNAILIGATGATGSDVLNLLLADDTFQRVDIFVRREINTKHHKLHVQVIDFEKPEQWKHLVKGEVLFSALGTTLKAAGGKDAQWRIDYYYQYEFAAAASQNGVRAYVLVSSANASVDSMIFYSKMKGKLEQAIKALDFESIAIYRPPILDRKGSGRTAEVVGLKVIRFMNKLGLLKSQKPMPTEILARAMINSAKKRILGVRSLEARDIWAEATDGPGFPGVDC